MYYWPPEVGWGIGSKRFLQDDVIVDWEADAKKMAGGYSVDCEAVFNATYADHGGKDTSHHNTQSTNPSNPSTQRSTKINKK